MLTEIRNPRQIPDEPRRRWFHSQDMDLIVWFDESESTESSPPIAFQLCYDKALAEKALSWKPEHGFTHMSVDDGETGAGKYKEAPLLFPDGLVDSAALQRRFAIAGQALPDPIRSFVTAKLALTKEGAGSMMNSAATTPDKASDPC